MRYQVEILIDLPRDEVIALFDDPDNLAKWQPNLLHMEHMSGEPGESGAKTRMVYKRGNGEMEMIETIVTRNLPDEFTANYETNGVLNINRNYFHTVSEKQTRWVTDTEFKFDNFMLNLMGMFTPFMFKNETRSTMQRFKEFAETGN